MVSARGILRFGLSQPLTFNNVKEAQRDSIYRRSLAIQMKGKFIPAAEYRSLSDEQRAKSGVFIKEDSPNSYSQNASQDTSRIILDMAAGAALVRSMTTSGSPRTNSLRIGLCACGDLSNRRRIIFGTGESRDVIREELDYLRPDIYCIFENDTARASGCSGGLISRCGLGYGASTKLDLSRAETRAQVTTLHKRFAPHRV